MDKQYIHYQNDISIEEIEAMINDMNDLFVLLEHFNEVLAYKQKIRHPSFGMFLRALHINNCNAITTSLQIRSILDKTMSDYFNSTNDLSSAHG